MLELDGLRVQQGDFALTADLRVPAGATVAVMGPSGGGKSTLLAVIAGFLAPVAGRVLWDGTEITALPPASRPVSVLFQDNNLFPHLSIAQNIGLALRPALRLTRDECAAVDAVLAQVGLDGLGARRSAQLSGGQQSRAALARVLIAQKPLVLLDEPFAALGPALRAEMLDLCAQTLGGAGRTLLMVTHDPQDARRIAGAVMVVEGGQVWSPTPTAQVLDNPPPGLQAYLGKE